MADILGERDAAVPEIPTRVSEPSRESQLPKRFYKAVAVAERDDGLRIELDGKPVRTPGKALLGCVSAPVMEAMAAEWEAQKDRIDPMTMPITRLANTALDGVANDMQAVKEDIIRFAGTDLLCYRAAKPEGLVARQMELWDPVLDWMQTSFNARFELAEGVMHIEQPPEAIAAFSAQLADVHDPLVLTCAHSVTTLSGSALLTLAVLKSERNLEQVWEIAHVDEDWNVAQWGEDDEAKVRRAKRFVEMRAAVETIQALI